MDKLKEDDILSVLIKTLKTQNEKVEELRDAIHTMASTPEYNEMRDSRTLLNTKYNLHSRDTVISPEVLKKINNTDQTYSLSHNSHINHQDELEKFEKYVVGAGKIWEAATKSIDKLQKKFDILNKSSKSDISDIQKENYYSVSDEGKNLTLNESQTVLEKKGFSAAVRRGIVDVDGLSKQEGLKESLGRMVGKGINMVGGIPMSHRRAYAREFVYPELEYKRAISEDEEERNKALPHEEKKVEDRRREIRKGNIDTEKLTEEQDLEKYRKSMVANANLKAVRSKSINYRPDLQQEWMVDAGKIDIDKSESELYNSKEIIERAKNPDQDVNLKITKEEKSKNITPLKRDDELGKLNTYGIPKEVFFKQEEQLVTLKNNLEALNRHSPDVGNEKGGLKEQYKIRIDNINTARNDAKNHYYGKDSQLDDAKKYTKLTESISKSLGKNGIKVNEFRADRLNIKELGVTNLLVDNLEAPNSSPNNETNVGSGLGVGDIATAAGATTLRTRATTVLGKVYSGAKNILKKAGPMLGRGIVGAGADYALGSLGGVGKDESGEDLKPDTFQDDINWNRMTTGEKVMSSIPRGIESIGNLFGLSNMSNQAKSDRIKKETEMYGAPLTPEKTGNVDVGISPKHPIPIQSEYISTVPDQKQRELSSAKYENDQLIQREKDISTSKQANPIIVNNQSYSGGQKQVPISQTTTRTTFNAYERFVNRTFTAV